jgi:hypothetical protein
MEQVEWPAGSQISEFGTVYGNFFLYRYPLLLAEKSFRDPYRYISSSGACFLREVFGKASGRLRDFPKPSRRNPEDNPAGIRPEILPGMAAKLLQNSRKKNYRIRYRTLKFCFGAPLYL